MNDENQSNTDEEWRPVPGYGDHYEASSLGRIRVKTRRVAKSSWMAGDRVVIQVYQGRLLSLTKSDKYGHLSVTIGVNKSRHKVFVHRLVLLAFIGEPLDGQVGCHNNGDASDNRISNLRWDSQASNNGDRKAHGRYATGEAHPMAKLTKTQAQEIFDSDLSSAALIDKFGIGMSQIHRIKRKQSWTDLLEDTRRLLA
jgi:hypothetical protein